MQNAVVAFGRAALSAEIDITNIIIEHDADFYNRTGP